MTELEKCAKHEYTGSECLVAHFFPDGRLKPPCRKCRKCGWVPFEEWSEEEKQEAIRQEREKGE